MSSILKNYQTSLILRLIVNTAATAAAGAATVTTARGQACCRAGVAAFVNPHFGGQQERRRRQQKCSSCCCCYSYMSMSCVGRCSSQRHSGTELRTKSFLVRNYASSSFETKNNNNNNNVDIDDKAKTSATSPRRPVEEEKGNQPKNVAIPPHSLLKNHVGTTTSTSAKSSSASSASSSQSSSWFPWSSFSQRMRRQTGNIMIALGFGANSVTSLLYSNSNQQLQQIQTSIKALQQFLKQSQIDTEVLNLISRTTSNKNRNNVVNQLLVLSRVQKKLLHGLDPRILVAKQKKMNNNDNDKNYDNDDAATPAPLPFTAAEALRYAKYAIAVYGNSAIQASRIMDSQERGGGGKMDTRFLPSFDLELSRARVSEHVGVPISDIAIIRMDEDDYGDNSSNGLCLRHFVAVDHAHQKVVLAIRGTFSMAETFANGVAFTRNFCHGQAHSEMANMAETLWDVCSKTVLDLLRANGNENYDLVITGHSLGAGTAALLNIMLHENQRELVLGRKIQCFAFATPPVFEPLEAAPEAVKNCVNFIHGADAVPFLSIDSVRHTMASLAKVGEVLNNRGLVSRMRLSLGYLEPDKALVEAVDLASKKRLATKPGAPVLYIPALHNLWIQQVPWSEKGTLRYEWKDCDSKRLATFGIQMDVNMLFDHFPQIYQHALKILVDEEQVRS